MIRTLRTLRWPLFVGYVLAGAVALMVATPIGLDVLGQTVDRVSFWPATITALPWSLLTFLVRQDSVTTLAVLAVGYVLNVGIGLMLARDAGE